MHAGSSRPVPKGRPQKPRDGESRALGVDFSRLRRQHRQDPPDFGENDNVRELLQAGGLRTYIRELRDRELEPLE